MYLVQWDDSRLVFGCVVPITPHRSSFESTRGVFVYHPPPFSLHPHGFQNQHTTRWTIPPRARRARSTTTRPRAMASPITRANHVRQRTRSRNLWNPPTPAPPTRCHAGRFGAQGWFHGAFTAPRARCDGERGGWIRVRARRARRARRRARAMERWDNFRSFARRRGHASNAIARAWRRSRTRRRTARGNPGDIGIGARRLTVERVFCRCSQVIKGRPTKVIEVTTSKTGKHGHAKCHFTALDIFTNKKMEELVPSTAQPRVRLSRAQIHVVGHRVNDTCPSWTTRVTLAKI